LATANFAHFKGGVWRHTQSPHLSPAPHNYFNDNAVAYALAHVPGTKITLAAGYGPLNYRDPPTRVVPFWLQTTA
jgi:hypothetical protein